MSDDKGGRIGVHYERERLKNEALKAEAPPSELIERLQRETTRLSEGHTAECNLYSTPEFNGVCDCGYERAIVDITATGDEAAAALEQLQERVAEVEKERDEAVEVERQWASFYRTCAHSGEVPNANLDKAWLMTEQSPQEARATFSKEGS